MKDMKPISEIVKAALGGDKPAQKRCAKLLHATWPAVKAAHGEATGKPGMSTIQQKLSAALKGDPRFDDGQRGNNGGAGPWCSDPWCVEILVPDDDGQMCAVVRCNDGDLVRVEFTWDGSDVSVSDAEPEPTEATTVYSAAIEEHLEVVKASFDAGSKRKVSQDAYKASADARGASDKAHETGTPEDHTAAAAAHDGAGQAHKDASEARDGKANGAKPHDVNAANEHDDQAERHGMFADEHRKSAAKAKPVESSQPVIRCQGAATKFNADETPVSDFQWMPGGKSTITASFGGKPITLTVECDEKTADAVKASFENAVKAAPRRPPFGCVEHREEDAAFRPKAFRWSDDPEPGVYCTAEWTELGVRNVRGKVHTSFSPSFTTDAEYAKATCGGCDKLNAKCKCADGSLVFPDGVRGSEANPARVTGVSSKSVGSLTNWNAFKNILPVKAKEPHPQGENKPNAENKKGPNMKVKFIKARGTFAAGTEHELPTDHEAVLAGDAMSLAAADIVLASAAADAARKESVKAAGKGLITAAADRALKRGALLPKGDQANSLDVVTAKHLALFETGAATAEIVAQLIDHLPGAEDDRLVMAQRRVQSQREDSGGGRVWPGDPTVQEICNHVVEARSPMSKLLPVQGSSAENVKAAARISAETCALLKAHVVPAFERDGDFALRNVVRATASDLADPNSQVGTLSSTLILMRNLGFLKNKLGWLPYISTDLRAEPAQFGQTVLTRYITPPGVLTFVPGVGYTSDATAISAYVANLGTNKALIGTGSTGLGSTQTSGTLTLSAPGATDVPVIINNHNAVEISFPTSTLGSTVRNLFAEQKGAMMYSLAEYVNKCFLATVFSATWAGAAVTSQSLGQNFGLPGTIKIKNAFSLNKLPDMGRFVVLHSIFHDQILTDANLLSAKAILSLIKKDAGSFEDGELPVLFGVKYLESQLAAFSTAGGNTTVAKSFLGLQTPTDPATIGTVAPDGIGFAGNAASALFVARIPNDYTKVLPDIPATAALEIVTEPDSGLSILSAKYLNHQTAAVNARSALMFGFAQGDPRQGWVLKP